MGGSARVRRLWHLVRSRWQDFDGLASAVTPAEAHRWLKQSVLFGFNGNVQRALVAWGLVKTLGVTEFVETGTCHASTALCARQFMKLPVHTCELWPLNYYFSKIITPGLSGVAIYKRDSRDFLRSYTTTLLGREYSGLPMFYLDAHEGQDLAALPIEEELVQVLRTPQFVAMIDDFKVPFDSDYKYGTYGGRSLELSLVAPILSRVPDVKLYFPSYSAVQESGYVSGYCVLLRGVRDLDLASYPLSLLRRYSL
jgi:hypothetical protein